MTVIVCDNCRRWQKPDQKWTQVRFFPGTTKRANFDDMLKALAVPGLVQDFITFDFCSKRCESQRLKRRDSAARRQEQQDQAAAWRRQIGPDLISRTLGVK